MRPTPTSTETDRITIRPAAPGDAPALLAMIHALSAHHGDPPETTLADVERDLFPSDGPPWALALIAAAGAQPIGYAALYRKPWLERGVRGMELHHLFVSGDWRSRGLGKRLVAEAIELARAAGCTRLSVGASIDNTRAHRFYPSAGFVLSTGPAGPRWKMEI